MNFDKEFQIVSGIDLGYKLNSNPSPPSLYPSFSPCFSPFILFSTAPEQRDAGATEEQDEGRDQGVKVQRDQTAPGLHRAGGGKHHAAETCVYTQAEPGQYEDLQHLAP